MTKPTRRNAGYQADADRMIGAALALEKAAKQLRERAKQWRARKGVPEYPQQPGAVTQLEWADHDAQHGYARAHLELTGEVCPECQQLVTPALLTTPSPGHADSCRYNYTQVMEAMTNARTQA